LDKNYYSKNGREDTKKAGTIPAFSEKKFNADVHLKKRDYDKKMYFCRFL
jgi:hypothetical protein